MLLVIGTFVVVFAFFLIAAIFGSEGKWRKLLSGVMIGAGIGFFAALFAFMVTLVFGMFMPTQWVVDQTYDLASLRNGESPEGSFWLGSGSVDSAMVYYFYTTDEAGGYHPASVTDDGDNVVIFEEDDQTTGTLVRYRQVTAYPYSLMAVGSGDPRYEFHIPAGSMILNYEVK